MNENTPQLPPDELKFDIGEEKTEIKEIKDCTLLPVLLEGHPMLSEKLEQYDFQSDETYSQRRKFSDDMLYTMRHLGAIGLSANQVGSKRRMFVMQKFDQKNNKPELLICYNPEIIKKYDEFGVKAEREGCVSFPGLSPQIKRAAAIEVSYQDDAGNFFETELYDIDARCFQHELDHLDGIVFTSYVPREIMNWYREKQRKLIKKARKQHERSIQAARAFSKNHGPIREDQGRELQSPA
jgi:peptide deformylase